MNKRKLFCYSILASLALTVPLLFCRWTESITQETRLQKMKNNQVQKMQSSYLRVYFKLVWCLKKKYFFQKTSETDVYHCISSKELELELTGDGVVGGRVRLCCYTLHWLTLSAPDTRPIRRLQSTRQETRLHHSRPIRVIIICYRSKLAKTTLSVIIPFTGKANLLKYIIGKQLEPNYTGHKSNVVL